MLLFTITLRRMPKQAHNINIQNKIHIMANWLHRHKTTPQMAQQYREGYTKMPIHKRPLTNDIFIYFPCPVLDHTETQMALGLCQSVSKPV